LIVKGHRGWVWLDPATLFVSGAVRGVTAGLPLAMIAGRFIGKHSRAGQTRAKQTMAPRNAELFARQW
jgi:hypothetical protein